MKTLDLLESESLPTNALRVGLAIAIIENHKDERTKAAVAFSLEYFTKKYEITP